MIVVEGPDGAGKSVLVDEIVLRFGQELQTKVVGADTVATTDLKAWVEHHNSLTSWDWPDDRRIYDRHRLVSEFIYGPIIGRPLEPGFSEWPWVLGQMIAFYELEPLIIYCLPPLEEVRKNAHREDTENSVVSPYTDQIWQSYAARAAIDVYAHKALLWDYTTMDHEGFITTLMNRLDLHYDKSI